MNRNHIIVFCVGAAALVMMTGNEGWGWLLLFALLATA